jgi:uncharacterized protein (TIGR02246 family)
MRVFTSLLVALTVAAGLRLAVAQDEAGRRKGPTASSVSLPASSTERDHDVRAIRDLDRAFAKAYIARDAKAIGALFTLEAEIEDEDGNVTRGREDIVARYTGYFAGGKSGVVSSETESLRFLGANIAIEDGVVSIANGANAEPRTDRYSVVYARQGDQWLQARVRDEPSEEASAHEHLQELS